ncbi:hypothetical protein ABIB49_002472 [Arthrobacter sp. UYCu512]
MTGRDLLEEAFRPVIRLALESVTALHARGPRFSILLQDHGLIPGSEVDAVPG